LLTGRLEGKRVGLLQELVPGSSLFGALINPQFAPATENLRDIENAVRGIRRELIVARANNDAEIELAFATFSGKSVGAVLVAGAPFFDTRRDRIIGLAAEYRIPAMYQFREYADAGASSAMVRALRIPTNRRDSTWDGS